MKTLYIDKYIKALRWVIYISIAISIASMLSSWMQYDLLSGYENGRISYSEFLSLADSNDIRESLVSFALLCTFIISHLIGGLWINHAAHFSNTLVDEKPPISPGWSVGWYFIPIAFLWKPYQAMTQLYRISLNPKQWNSIDNPAILPIWWSLWIVSSISASIMTRLYLNAEELSAIQTVSLVDLILTTVDIALAFVFLRIAQEISKNFQRLNSPIFSIDQPQHTHQEHSFPDPNSRHGAG